MQLTHRESQPETSSIKGAAEQGPSLSLLITTVIAVTGQACIK